MSSALEITPSPGGVRFRVHVQPRAKRNEIAGVHGTALKVRLAAPPVAGAANAALIGLLAAALGITRRDVRILTGMMSREKLVEIDGIDVAHITALARTHTR